VSGGESAPGRLLVVEDDPGGRELLVTLLESEGYQVEAFVDGETAWRRLAEGGGPFNAILLDRQLPGADGLDVLRRINRDAALATTPVILQTALSDRASMLEGVAAGAYYYVAKPIDRDLLRTVVASAVEDQARYHALQEALARGAEAIATLQEGVFRFRTVEQASALASLLSQACPDAERTVVGLGELLVNAVEHGNLGISYEEKTRLLADGSWGAEVARRLELPENRDKRVVVEFRKDAYRIVINIQDEGPGFEWRRYLTISPERVFHSHGRGIAMAGQLSFDRLEFHDPGNRVTAIVERNRHVDHHPSQG
jgi:CheY-like chemotaxis protein/anti-sigma regulatory factor (Ser/Thr protein kinase)